MVIHILISVLLMFIVHARYFGFFKTKTLQVLSSFKTLSTQLTLTQVISGSNIGEKVFIPKLSLSPSDVKIPFKFQRRQFSIFVSFVVTINKSQGQSLKSVEIYLSSRVFSHGQLYVVISRVTSKQGLKILIVDGDRENTDTTSNVVYHEVFRNES